jgi:hypothetical protein
MFENKVSFTVWNKLIKKNCLNVLIPIDNQWEDLVIVIQAIYNAKKNRLY